MPTIPVFVSGVGSVGAALIQEFLRTQPGVRQRPLRIVGLADQSGAFGISHLQAAIQRKIAGDALARQGLAVWTWPAQPGVWVDASCGDRGEAWRAALERGWSVVSANKTPLADTDDPWRPLWMHGRLALGGTVGAGVPSCAALRELLNAEDSIISIRGVVSGTLSTVVGDLAAGTPLADSVEAARLAGITEPDPQVDLSGQDVARKLTILGKLAGLWERPPRRVAEPVTEAAVRALGAPGPGLAYVGQADHRGVRCQLQRLPPDDLLGRLRPTENGVSFQTARFAEVPYTVVGPSRGPAVTARTLLADIVLVASRLTA